MKRAYHTVHGDQDRVAIGITHEDREDSPFRPLVRVIGYADDSKQQNQLPPSRDRCGHKSLFDLLARVSQDEVVHHEKRRAGDSEKVGLERVETAVRV
jgi:hypothetical protein